MNKRQILPQPKVIDTLAVTEGNIQAHAVARILETLVDVGVGG